MIVFIWKRGVRVWCLCCSEGGQQVGRWHACLPCMGAHRGMKLEQISSGPAGEEGKPAGSAPHDGLERLRLRAGPDGRWPCSAW